METSDTSMTTNTELADEIEGMDMGDCAHLRADIIAALRQPSSDKVLVPREPTHAIIQAMNAAYWQLADRPKATQGDNVYVDEYAASIYRAMLAAVERNQ